MCYENEKANRGNGWMAVGSGHGAVLQWIKVNQLKAEWLLGLTLFSSFFPLIP